MEFTPPAPGDAPASGPSIDGVVLLRLSTHVDHRGSLTPIMGDPGFWAEPVVHAYRITIEPGRIKGWGLHRQQTDRYFLAQGSVRVVVYDGRVGSPSHERFDQFYFDERTPSLLRIPPGVWHADQNVGEHEVAIVNFPTRAYDPEQPDKFRIDPHSGEIPFDWALRDR
jgi:dTDP-4-dehydrorhamnose 3,5-epimerase